MSAADHVSDARPPGHQGAWTKPGKGGDGRSAAHSELAEPEGLPLFVGLLFVPVGGGAAKLRLGSKTGQERVSLRGFLRGLRNKCAGCPLSLTPFP